MSRSSKSLDRLAFGALQHCELLMGLSLVLTFTLSALHLEALHARPSHAQPPNCPPLPSIEEILQGSTEIMSKCNVKNLMIKESVVAQSVTGQPRVLSREILSRQIDPMSAWIIDQIVWRLDKYGATGWRIYRPITSRPSPHLAPDHLPHFDLPSPHCNAQRDMIVRKGEVWGVERWSIRAPRPQETRLLSLGHSHYVTLRIQLSATHELFSRSDQEITPRGVCPSLMNSSPTQPAIACGRGADSRQRSALQWRHL